MNRTNIEWVKNPDGSQGFTWNPLTGCLNHTNGLCKGGGFPCYTYRLANGRLKQRYLAQHDYIQQLEVKDIRMTEHPDQDPFYPRFWPERLASIYDSSPRDQERHFYQNRKDKGIFVCDMSDLFGVGIPEHWTYKVLEAIRCNSRDRFYLLTKQPQNLIKFSPFPPNCWVGATCTSTNMFAQSLIKMQGMKAKIKYISFEPLLEWNWNNTYQEPLELVLRAEGIDWLIIGAQIKPKKMPKIEWVREIVEAADKAGVAVFLKNNLWPIFPDDEIIPSWAQMEKGKYRQELPNKGGDVE